MIDDIRYWICKGFQPFIGGDYGSMIDDIPFIGGDWVL